MVLVDTPVWIDHLRRGNQRLGALVNDGLVAAHPFVIGELSCGTLANRSQILALLGALPATPEADHDEVLQFVANERLHGRGLGWIDVHLLAAAQLAGCRLWSLDKRLAAAATLLRLGDGT